jgi:hypothetical protein
MRLPGAWTRWRGAGLTVACLVLGLGLDPEARVLQTADSPEVIIRRLVSAIYSNDAAEYNAVTIEHPLRSRLTSEGRPNAQGLRRLKDDPASLQIRQQRPILVKGVPLTTPPGGDAPVEATALFMVSHGGAPTVVPLVRRAEGWKVDIRWWIASTEAMSSARSNPPGSPDRTVRALLAAMLQFDRQRAATFLTDPRALNVLFTGAPRTREPSGVLEATAEEMPLVEIGPGEFYPSPGQRVIEGGSTDDRKVLVGLFGPVEIPFVLRRQQNAWKVEAEPFFTFMNR